MPNTEDEIGNLVLTRLPGETVVIDSQTTVTVVSVRGDRVKLSFNAPKRVPIVRGEIEKGFRGRVDAN